MSKQQNKQGAEEAIRRIEEAERTKAEALDLGGLDLTAIPKEVCQLTNLQELYLGRNHIRLIPAMLGLLANLRKLDFSHNQITEIPDSLGQLAALQVLHLNENQIGHSGVPFATDPVAHSPFSWQSDYGHPELHY